MDMIQSHGLVIDYDENVTIKEALATFGAGLSYESVLLTSFNSAQETPG